MRSLRHLVLMKLSLLVLFSVCQIPSTTNAQSLNLQGKFCLQSEVHWGKAVLPAGEYSLTIDSKMTPQGTIYAIVRSADGRKAAVAMATVTGRLEPGGSFIFITNDGTRRVRLLNLPEHGVSLVFGPLISRDREQLYAARIEVVPVTLAEKARGEGSSDHPMIANAQLAKSQKRFGEQSRHLNLFRAVWATNSQCRTMLA